MKKILLVAAAAMLSVQSPVIFAAPDSPFYVGALIGDSTLNIRARTHIENEPTVPQTIDFEANDSQTYSLAAEGGFLFADNFGVEVQYLTSLMPDKVFGTVKVNNDPKSEMESKVNALGVFGVLQLGSELYGRVKLGVGKAEASFDTDFASASYSTTGLSFGLAVGQQLGSYGSVELTYTRYPDIDVNKTDFAKSFGSSPAYNSYTKVSSDLALQAIMVGYIFKF
jgi:hypothetical protein